MSLDEDSSVKVERVPNFRFLFLFFSLKFLSLFWFLFIFKFNFSPFLRWIFSFWLFRNRGHFFSLSAGPYLIFERCETDSFFFSFIVLTSKSLPKHHVKKDPKPRGSRVCTEILCPRGRVLSGLSITLLDFPKQKHGEGRGGVEGCSACVHIPMRGYEDIFGISAGDSRKRLHSMVDSFVLHKPVGWCLYPAARDA